MNPNKSDDNKHCRLVVSEQYGSNNVSNLVLVVNLKSVTILRPESMVFHRRLVDLIVRTRIRHITYGLQSSLVKLFGILVRKMESALHSMNSLSLYLVEDVEAV